MTLSTAPHGDETILLVDDDDSVRLVLRQALVKKGYTVLEAENGAAALEVFDDGSEIDLVITDAVMPVMGGFELVTRLEEKSPGTKVLLISGYTQSDSGIGGNRILGEGTHFLRKPFSTGLLAIKLREMLDEDRSS